MEPHTFENISVKPYRELLIDVLQFLLQISYTKWHTFGHFEIELESHNPTQRQHVITPI